MSETELKITEIDVVSGEVIERTPTEDESANYQLAVQSQEQFDLEIKSKQEAKASALAKLAALGLTEEEIAAL